VLGGLVVGQACGGGLEPVQSGTGFEKRFGIGERGQFLEGRHDQLLWIALFYFAFPIHRVLGEQTRAVEVEIGIEVLGAEEVDLGREALRDMAVAEALEHHGALAESERGLFLGDRRHQSSAHPHRYYDDGFDYEQRTMAMAVNFAYRRDRVKTMILMLVTAVFGAMFVGMQAFEWGDGSESLQGVRQTLFHFSVPLPHLVMCP